MDISLMTFSMMKDAVLRKLDAEALCGICGENRLQQVDMMETEIKLYKQEKLKKAFAEHDITLGCLITNLPFYAEPGKVEEKAVAALETAQRFGTKMLMVVPGSGMGTDAKKASAMSRQEALDRAVEMYLKVTRLAAGYGIKVGFENTPQTCKPLASAEDCRYVLDRVPELGFIFDAGNFRVADTSADELAIYEQLKDRIIRVHLKDVVIGKFRFGEKCLDGQSIVPVTTGSGLIPIYELIQKLKEDGYLGDLAIEYSEKNGVSGKANGIWVAPYVSYIRGAIAGTQIKPPYIHIEGLDKPVSRILYGTAMMPFVMGKDGEYLLDAAYSIGINTFDCARGYGMAEKSLGSWVKKRNNRDRVVILTKCCNVGSGGKVCVNRKAIERDLQKSLKALQMDYIDIYLLHRDDPTTPVSEIIDVLNDAKGAGKIKVFGVSNWTDARIAEANAYAASKGLEGFAVSSPNYGLTITKEDPWGGDCISISGPENESARAWYRANQMPILAYSSLGRGFFSGRFKSGDYEGAKKVLDGPAQKGYLCEENMQRLKRAEELAAKYGTTVSEIAMRYIFASPMQVCAIVSTSNPRRMVQNVNAANNALTAEDVAYLES